MKKLLFVTLLTLSFISCSSYQPVIKEVKVPTPCEVEVLPQKPKDIDLENSSIGVIMIYVKDIVSYAKQVEPIIDNCVVKKQIKEKK